MSISRLFVCLLVKTIYCISLHLQYYLNVCRPLVPQYGLSCNANSAACRAILNGTKNPEQEQVNAFESIIRCQFSVLLFFSSLPFYFFDVCQWNIFFFLSLLNVHTNSMSLFHSFQFSMGFIHCKLSIFLSISLKKRALANSDFFVLYILWYSKNQNAKKHISNCNEYFHFKFDGFHWRAAIYTSTNLIEWEELVAFFQNIFSPLFFITFPSGIPKRFGFCFCCIYFCVSVLFMRGICWFVRVWDIHEHRWHLYIRTMDLGHSWNI